jgi:APA family basic amino acid/polyamine antiporter
VTALIGASGARLVAATVVVSTLGCNAAAVIGMSRTCYAMASDGLFFKAAAAVHPRYRTPHVAIAITCAWSALLTLTGTYEQLFTWVTFASVAFGVLGGLAIFRLRRLKPDVPRHARTWGYPIVPALFVAGLGVLVVNTVVEKPAESLIGVLLVALGLPALRLLAVGALADAADVNGRAATRNVTGSPGRRRPPRKFTAGAA